MSKNLYRLTTPYAEELGCSVPWQDYPRPSMVRESYISLNGEWELSVGGEDMPSEYQRRIRVPFPYESELSGIGESLPEGSYLHYRKSFTLPEGFLDSRLILHIGAADSSTRVWVNGKFIGDHEGGYLPFSFDITDALSGDTIEVKIRVFDDLSGKYPYGKQTKKRGGMWYTPVSGIWQSVWLESVAEKYIESIVIDADDKRVKISLKGGEPSATLRLESGEEYSTDNGVFELSPSEPRLWTPENPEIYRFTVKAGDDTVSSYFAMRKIEVRDALGIPRLYLNGKPYLFNGLLDQGYYPDGIFLPASPGGYRDDIMRAKSLGFNTLRKHIKVEPEIFYYLCDTLGMAVFQDMVNNSGYSFLLDTALPTVGLKRLPDSLRHRDPETRRIFTEHSLKIIERLRSFPSVLYYTVFNEGWGQFEADKLYKIIKDADPTRIVDATSGWFTRNESDVDSRHIYFKPIKVKKHSARPISISEFGGYSYRVEGHLFGDDNYGYTICKSADEFAERFEALYREEIIPAIKMGASALVYTQISDVEDETNGLITYDRRVVKLDCAKCSELMKKIYTAFDECTGG